MKKILLMSILVLALFSVKANYVPAVNDFVLPQSWQLYTLQITNPVWTDPTGCTDTGYNTYFKCTNKRFKVTWVFYMGAQLYANLQPTAASASGCIILWPVNYVDSFTGTTTDFLIKTL